jgi:phosphatidylinositol alpha-mannosyltransferase
MAAKPRSGDVIGITLPDREPAACSSTLARMRVGLVSPYSHSYLGGVGRHVEALAEELIEEGHEVRVFAPHDPDDRLARVMHAGVAPDPRPLPEYVVPISRSVSWGANGATSTMGLTPGACYVPGKEIRAGRFDVLHVHEPHVPVVSWSMTAVRDVPVIGTFHCYSTRVTSHFLANYVLGAKRRFNNLAVRIAVSEAARWRGERFWGGRYRVIPNGVHLNRAMAGPKPAADHLRLLFVGRADERKGLPVLLPALEALRATGVDARLVVAGATHEELAPFLVDAEGVEVAGRVSEEEKWRLLHEADLLCAPSLSGESFGMVLTEAFASGTPVVASDIGGYRDLVRDGREGLLVPPGRPAELGHALHALAHDPDRRARMSAAARERAERFAWPRVAGEVLGAYEDALAVPEPAKVVERAADIAGVRPADGLRRRPARRLPPPEPAHTEVRRGRRLEVARKGALGVGVAAAAGLTALALQRIGLERVAGRLVGALPFWVITAFLLMCGSMLMRAEAWHAILRAALPGERVRRRDTARATAIGVLMSATLPARLGEPSRAFVMARRLGRVSDRLPVALGTIASQTLLNILAIVLLGAIMFATVGLFRGGEDALVVATLAPVLVLVGLLAAPALLRGGASARSVRVRAVVGLGRRAMTQMRTGLKVFARPRLGAWAVFVQLSAWVVQWLSCYALLVALNLDGRAGLWAAAAVLFAVNVTAALPATPSNVGVFQAACVAVLTAYGVSATGALAYGIILQAVEIATALFMGTPALLREGLTWRDLRLRAMRSAPVQLGGAGAEA